MAVGFSHGGANMGYAQFGMLRRCIALYEGIDLDGMHGYGGTRPWSTVDTPVRDFLDHDDDRGHLTPDQCAVIEPRLRHIVDELWPADVDDYPASSYRQQGVFLCNGMREAADKREDFLFM
jgi:hypothetical protein